MKTNRFISVLVGSVLLVSSSAFAGASSSKGVYKQALPADAPTRDDNASEEEGNADQSNKDAQQTDKKYAFKYNRDGDFGSKETAKGDGNARTSVQAGAGIIQRGAAITVGIDHRSGLNHITVGAGVRPGDEKTPDPAFGASASGNVRVFNVNAYKIDGKNRTGLIDSTHLIDVDAHISGRGMIATTPKTPVLGSADLSIGPAFRGKVVSEGGSENSYDIFVGLTPVHGGINNTVNTDQSVSGIVGFGADVKFLFSLLDGRIRAFGDAGLVKNYQGAPSNGLVREIYGDAGLTFRPTPESKLEGFARVDFDAKTKEITASTGEKSEDTDYNVGGFAGVAVTF